MDKKINLSLVTHVGKPWILVRFEPDAAWNKRMKAVPGSCWTKTYKGWLVPDTPANRKLCKIGDAAVGDPSSVIASWPSATQLQPAAIPKQRSYTADQPSPEKKLSKENLLALGKFLEQLKLKAYSPSTIRTYRNEFLQLLQLLKKNRPAICRPMTSKGIWCM